MSERRELREHTLTQESFLFYILGVELMPSCLPGRHCAPELSPWPPTGIVLKELASRVLYSH